MSGIQNYMRIKRQISLQWSSRIQLKNLLIELEFIAWFLAVSQMVR